MCSPDARENIQQSLKDNASFGMAGAQFGSSLLAQKGQADLQEAANEAAKESAKEAQQVNNSILLRRRQEEADAFAQTNFDRQRRAMELQAQANVSAGEAGVSGISVDRITRDIERQSGEVAQRTRRSFENRLAALDDQQTKSISAMRARMANLPPIVQPNLLATAMNATAGLIESGAIDDLMKRQREYNSEKSSTPLSTGINISKVALSSEKNA